MFSECSWKKKEMAFSVLLFALFFFSVMEWDAEYMEQEEVEMLALAALQLLCVGGSCLWPVGGG